MAVGGALCLLCVGVGGVSLSACDWFVVVWVCVVPVSLPHAGVHGVGVSVPAAPHHPDRTSTLLLQHLLQTGRETAAPRVLMSPRHQAQQTARVRRDGRSYRSQERFRLHASSECSLYRFQDVCMGVLLNTYRTDLLRL